MPYLITDANHMRKNQETNQKSVLFEENKLT